MKRLKKILTWFFFSLLFLMITGAIILNSNWGQNFIVKQVSNRLSNNLKAKIRIGYISFSLFNRMNLEGLLMEDQKKDTLLYAGKMMVRVTDWFFLKNKIDLKFIGLENAVINLNRQDSVWNYTFLQDYFFAGTSTGPKKSITFDLKKIELKNVLLSNKDGWLGVDLIVALNSFELDAKEINFSTRNVDIGFMVLSNPTVQIKNYAGLKPNRIPTNDTVQLIEKSDSILKWNVGDWKVKIDNVKITEGVFKNEKQSDSPYFTHFDGRLFEFSGITGNFKNVKMINDTLTTSLSLASRERSGLEIKSFLSDLKVTPGGMAFTDLEIKTNKSIIRNAFSMRYTDIGEFSDFIDKVKLTAAFENSEIDSDDIAYFAPALSTWKKKILVSGNVRGSIDDLFGSDMKIRAGRNTILYGDISLTGLPDINKTFIDFQADNFQTTYTDAVTFVPFLKTITTPRLQNISYLKFNGNFTGFLRDFVTYGTIQTNLGSVTSDINMKLPIGKAPFYSGKIASTNFNLGQFLNDSRIGNISFTSEVVGKGFQWNSLAAHLDAKIHEIVYNKYAYKNIIAKGDLDNKVFNGDFSINDSNAVFSLSGMVDLRNKIPKFNFLADAERVNLKQLNLIKENYSLKGNFDLDFSGSSIDNFLGRANITEATFFKDGKSIYIDSILLNSSYNDGIKQLTLKSDEIEGFINGDFTVKELPDAFTLFLNKYYPSYIKAPSGKISDQDFSFSFQMNYITDYISLVDSNLVGFNHSEVKGRLNTTESLIELKTDLPSFSYKNFQFENVQIDGKGNLENLAVSFMIDHLKVNDSLNFPFTKIDIDSRNDSTDFRIITESNNKNIPGGSIRALVRTHDDGLSIRFDSSRFILNGKNWTIEKDGELDIRSNTVSHGEIVLKESNQEISIRTQPSDVGNWNDVRIDIKNFNIGDVTQIFIKSNNIEGLVTGSVIIEDPVNKFNVVSDIQTDQLRLDNDSIGQLKAHVLYNHKTGKLAVTGQSLNPEEKLNFDLDLFVKELATDPEDVINLELENYPLKFAERFIGTLFTDLQGYATGELKIAGKGNKRKYTGNAKLHDAGLNVTFTRVFYKIQDTEIVFREDALDLGSMKLIDTVTKNTATLSRGLIKHDSWKNMEFDIRAEVDNRPMLLLNTSFKDNQSFYGMAKGTGSFSLTGHQSNMKMKIFGTASTVDSSYITIPNTSSRESGIADFLIERKYGREMSDSMFKTNESNLTYDVDLTANEMVNIRVVLDELTNDEIRGRGEGNLRIFSGTTEPLSIRGRYNINEGNYRFSFQSFFKKPFELKENAGNYIEWNGDPFHPIVKIEAVYKTEKKVDFAPLISGVTNISNLSGLRDYVYVIANLSGDLFKPDITFALDFPPESPPKQDLSLSFILDQIQQNENELNKQVAFLVVFNSFAPSDVSTSLSLSSGVDLVVNSISGFLSSQINKVLNNILSNKLKIPGLYVNFSGSLYNPNPFGEGNSGFSYDRTNFNLAVAKTFFNNRVVLTFEGSYDVPFQTTSTQLRTDVLSNFTMEFLLNQSGTVRATIFYKENVDFLSGTSTSGNNKSRRYGGSLAYRREFNKLSELVGKKNRLKESNIELEKKNNE
ncbi:MAG TPA: hypothetical protein VI548_04505 [Chitinophagaceae bacterium]|nr:hypothetical protein [Chitinophagaceae bacterium]